MFGSRNTLGAPTQGREFFGLMERRQQCWSPETDQALAFNLKFLQSIKFVFSEVQAGDRERTLDEHNYSVPLIESRCEASAGLNDDRFNGNTTLRPIFRHNFEISLEFYRVVVTVYGQGDIFDIRGRFSGRL